MSESNGKVNDSVNKIAIISEGNMASIEQLSDTAREQTAAVEEVTSHADNLSKIANDLNQAVVVFEN